MHHGACKYCKQENSAFSVNIAHTEEFCLSVLFQLTIFTMATDWTPTKDGEKGQNVSLR